MGAPIVAITARPLAPPTPSGLPGAYGIWHADALLANGETVWGRGLGEREAREHAALRAALQWAEVERLLTAEEQARDAEESGEVDRRDVEFDTLGA